MPSVPTCQVCSLVKTALGVAVHILLIKQNNQTQGKSLTVARPAIPLVACQLLLVGRSGPPASSAALALLVARRHLPNETRTQFCGQNLDCRRNRQNCLSRQRPLRDRKTNFVVNKKHKQNTAFHCNSTRSTQPCIPPESLNRVPANSAGVRAGMSLLPGGR